MMFVIRLYSELNFEGILTIFDDYFLRHFLYRKMIQFLSLKMDYVEN